MINIKVFERVANLLKETSIKEDKNYAEFLEFYKALVTSMPTEAIKKFDRMSISVTAKGVTKNYGLELTVTDYIWWKQEIEQLGTRFTNGPISVQSFMLTRMSKNVETFNLSIEERKELLEALINEK